MLMRGYKKKAERGFPGGSDGKNLPAVWEAQLRSLGREDPPEKEMATHSSFFPVEFHGQRSLVGYDPWGRLLQRVGHE